MADWETNDIGRLRVSRTRKSGHQVASAYTAGKDRSKRNLYRDRLWAGADLLSLGVASFGHIGGVHYQNHHDFDVYARASVRRPADLPRVDADR